MDCQNWDHPKGWIGVIISIRRPSFLGILPAAGFRRFVTTAVVTLDSLFVEMQRQTFCRDAETNWCIFCTFATLHNEGIRLTTWFWGGDEPSICKCLKPRLSLAWQILLFIIGHCNAWNDSYFLSTLIPLLALPINEFWPLEGRFLMRKSEKGP